MSENAEMFKLMMEQVRELMNELKQERAEKSELTKQIIQLTAKVEELSTQSQTTTDSVKSLSQMGEIIGRGLDKEDNPKLKQLMEKAVDSIFAYAKTTPQFS